MPRKKQRNLAFHFVGKTLRDGQPVPADGVWLEHKGPLKLCVSGLHFSRDPFDALTYAPGNTLCLVEIDGEIIEKDGDDKGVCSRRKIIARMDATELLRYFARMQALSVIHLNEDLCNSEVVCDYLMTGDEAFRAAAEDAAWEAARAAARDAARATARAAAENAARSAAWAAVRAAARDAAGAAAEAAARDAARDVAWDAAWAAAWAATRQYFNELVYECFSDFL